MKIHIILFVMILGVMRHAGAQIVFSDDFELQSTNANNQNINLDIGVSRQTTGTTSTYTGSGANGVFNVSSNDDGITNNGSGSPTSNQFARMRANEQNVGPVNLFLDLGTNFASSLAGTPYTISFDLLYRKRDTSTTDQWVGFAFGDTVPSSSSPNSSETDFGVLLRPDGINPANNRLARFYDDAAVSAGDDFTTTPVFTSDYVTFTFTVTEAANGLSATVDGTADATTILSNFAIDFDNNTGRYFAFSAHLGPDATPGAGGLEFADSFIDNVSITTIPEPSSFLLLGVACLAGLALRGRKRA